MREYFGNFHPNVRSHEYTFRMGFLQDVYVTMDPRTCPTMAYIRDYGANYS